MIIFNNGKYKSILAAEKDELAEIAETVQKDKDFRPHFHIAPPTGLMNDPNGLIFDSGKAEGRVRKRAESIKWRRVRR